METIIAFAITLLAVGFVGYPLLRNSKQQKVIPVAEELLEVDTLMSKKETAINAIRELEFDYTVGNLSDEDYEELKDKYERRAISILKSLDELQEEDKSDHIKKTNSRTAEIATSSTGKQQSEDRVCPRCHKTYGPQYRFCTTCGVELSMSMRQEELKTKAILGNNPSSPDGKVTSAGKREGASRSARNRSTVEQKALSGKGGGAR